MKNIWLGMAAAFSLIIVSAPKAMAQIISGNTYQLISTCGTGNSVMSVLGGSAANGAAIVVATKNANDPAQLFKIESYGGAYTLTAQNSGKVIDVPRSSIARGTGLIQYTFGGSNNQLFRILKVSTGVYRLQNVNSGLYIDLTGSNTASGTTFIQYSLQGAASCNQSFQLKAVGSAPTLAPSPSTNWTYCANENQFCAFSGINMVRYGAGTTWVTKSFAGGVSCSNSVFGDPAYGVVKSCQISTLAPSPSPTPAGSALFTDSIFAPTSFWYTPIPANVTLDPNSANLVQDFLRQKSAYYGTVNVNSSDYSSPVYIASAGAPTVAVGFNDCQGKGYFDSSLQQQWSAVPMPSYAAPALGTDSEITIYQPSTHTIWEFWVTLNQSGQWTACWGGRLQNTSQSQGFFPGNYGTTATGLPFLGGQVTAEELQRGEIRHAIGIALVDLAAWNVVSWPAQRSDGNGNGPIAEGQRFRLDPAINVDALAMSQAGKIIAKAAQKYGFIVWDKAGAISIRAQNVTSYTALGQPDPYHPTLFDGNADYQVLEGFPWDQLQFLPMNYGQPQ